MSDVELMISEISVCGNTNFDDSEELLYYLEEIARINRSQRLTNQITDIDYDEPQESEIRIGVMGDRDLREEDENLILVNTVDSESDELHLHIYTEGEYTNDFSELFREITSLVGRIDVDIYTAYLFAETSFQELDLEISVSLPGQYSASKNTGIRFHTGEGHDILLQESGEGGIYIRFGDDTGFTIDESTEANFIQSHLQYPKGLIQELVE